MILDLGQEGRSANGGRSAKSQPLANVGFHVWPLHRWLVTEMSKVPSPNPWLL